MCGCVRDGSTWYCRYQKLASRIDVADEDVTLGAVVDALCSEPVGMMSAEELAANEEARTDVSKDFRRSISAMLPRTGPDVEWTTMEAEGARSGRRRCSTCDGSY